jgi:hypothetical protein
MSGHIVGPFGVVIVGPILRCETIKIGFDVAAHGRIGILLDQERSRGMLAKTLLEGQFASSGVPSKR